MGVRRKCPTLFGSCARYLLTCMSDFSFEIISLNIKYDAVHHFYGKCVKLFLWGHANSQHHPWNLVDPGGSVELNV